MIITTPHSRQMKPSSDFPDSRSYAAYTQNFFGFPVGISMLEGPDRVVVNSKEYESSKSEEYHGIVFQFDTSKLSKTQKEVLYVLENRAKEFHGETKIYNKRIAALIGKSLSTVEKSIRKLEELKFISTYSTKYFRKGQFYSDRMIRCKRTWFEAQFKIAKPTTWRHCKRPKNTQGAYLLEYKNATPLEVKAMVWQKITMTSALEFGLYDREEQARYQEYLDYRDLLHYEEGVSRLGYKKTKVGFDYLIPVDVEYQRKLFYLEKPSGPDENKRKLLDKIGFTKAIRQI